MAKTGDDHGQLGPLDLIQLTRIGRLSGLKGLVDVAQCPLAVDLDGSVEIEAGQSSGGTNLSKRLAVVAGEISGDSSRLPDDGDAARVGRGVARVLVGRLGIVVEEALNHNQVPGDVLSVGTSQSAQIAPRTALKVCWLDVVRDLGLGDTLTLRRPTSTLVPRVLPPRAVLGTACPPITAVAAPVTAVPVAAPFIAPVVTVPTIVARGVFASAQPMGMSVGAVGVVVPSRMIATAKATVLL